MFASVEFQFRSLQEIWILETEDGRRHAVQRTEQALGFALGGAGAVLRPADKQGSAVRALAGNQGRWRVPL